MARSVAVAISFPFRVIRKPAGFIAEAHREDNGAKAVWVVQPLDVTVAGIGKRIVKSLDFTCGEWIFPAKRYSLNETG
jgi:hypothetical protein